MAVDSQNPVEIFGDFLGFNPHLHVLDSDGCFYGDGPAKAGFRVSPSFELKDLEKIFRLSWPQPSTIPADKPSTIPADKPSTIPADKPSILASELSPQSRRREC